MNMVATSRLLKLSLTMLFLPAVSNAAPDSPVTFNLKVFSHLEGGLNDRHSPGGKRDYTSLGETSIFSFGEIGERLSYLYEGTYQPKRYRNDTFKNERWQLRYELNSNHFLLVGKNHTPVNQWNDTFHHGRLFYPTISRPRSLEYFIPLHDHVVRLGGRALGERGFFYDLTLGSGHRYEDELFPQGVKSLTLSAGIESLTGQVIRFGFHRNEAHMVGHGHGSMPAKLSMNDRMHSSHGAHGLHDMSAMPGHSGHGHKMRMDTISVGASSIIFNVGRLRAMSELAISHGSNGTERNRAIFQYVGYQLNDIVTAYGLFDWIRRRPGYDLDSGIESNLGVGAKFGLSQFSDIKVEAVRHRVGLGSMAEVGAGYEFRMQLSIGFP